MFIYYLLQGSGGPLQVSTGHQLRVLSALSSVAAKVGKRRKRHVLIIVANEETVRHSSLDPP